MPTVNKQYEGSTLESFLAEEGIREECTQTAMRRAREYKEKYLERATVDPQVENPEKR